MNFTSGQIDIGGRPPPTGGSADLTAYMKTAIANTTFINETGDAMRGDLSLGGFKITNLQLLLSIQMLLQKLMQIL